jgi:tubulin-like protein
MIRRSLIIALGGTGTNIVERLRDRFHMRFGTPEPEGVRFLYIDTDVNENQALRRYPDRSVALRVGAEKLRDCQQWQSATAENLRLDEWFDPELRQRLTNQNFEGGVGGVRMYGRLALLASDHLGSLMGKLETDANALRRSEDGRDPGPLHLFVVSSAGGGTGSGTFVDVGYLTNHVLRGLNIGGDDCIREGVLAVAVPSLVPAPKQARNSAAVLTELDHFSEAQNVFKARYAGSDLAPEIGREAPYDYTALVAPTQGDQVLHADPRVAIRRLEQKVGDYLFVRITGPGEIGARLRDLRTNWEEKPTDNHGYPTRFLTFGVGLRQFPAGICESIGYRSAVANFVQGWLKRSRSGERHLDESLISTDPALRQRWDQDLEELRRMLGLPPEHVQGTKEPRDCHDDRIYRELIQTQQEALESALRSRSREGSVDDLFEYQGSSQPVSPGQRGYVKGTIVRNRERLLDPHESISLYNSLRSHFLNAAFDLGRGPRYALLLLRKTLEMLKQEEAFLDEVRQAAGVAGRSLSTDGADARKARRDPLLPPFYHDIVARRERGLATHVSADYANRLYDHCLAEAKGAIYAYLRDGLLEGGENLSHRLWLLIEYVEFWKGATDSTAGGDEELLGTLPPGTVYPQELVRQKLQKLTPTVSPHSLAGLNRTVTDQTFLQGLPRIAEGGYDFGPFTSIETQIREALRATGKQPHESIHSESVIRLLSEAEGGATEAASRDMVTESRPLLNLRLDSVGYGELLDSQPPVFPAATHFWYFVSAEHLEPESHRRFMAQVKKEAQAIALPLRADREEPIQHIHSSEGSYAAALFLRGAFPTRVLNQYDPQGRLNLLYPPNAREMTTPFTQTGIRPPRPPQDIEEAQSLLLLGEALLANPQDSATVPRITWGATEHIYHYPIDAHRTGSLSLDKMDFEAAAYKLATTEKAMESLRREINLVAQDPIQRGEILKRIAGHVVKLQERLKAARAGYYDGLDLAKLDYSRAIHRLMDGVRKRGLSLDPYIDPKDHRWATLTAEDRLWRCNRCRFVLGTSMPALDGQCPNCGHPEKTEVS